jgi:diaminobutyrate-2-oxoglutarate transaminase
MNVLERFESVAQNYVRAAPIVFDKARGSELFDEKGVRYIDFHSAGGSLSHGHGDIRLTSALIDYLCNDRLLQCCDRTSLAKRRFVEAFVDTILKPFDTNYRMLFVDPAAGAAAEVAMRLARRHKNRTNMIAFTNSCHGLTEGALSVTGKPQMRGDVLDLRRHVTFMPYCDYFGDGIDTVSYLKRLLEDSASGVELPAAVIVEVVQVQGGVNIASPEWLQALEKLCRKLGILLIADETHSGGGRTGPYFCFERAGLKPDMIIVPNSLGGGHPMSMLLFRPELDHWRPGEQVGLFQGSGLAFTAGTELLAAWKQRSPDDFGQRSHILDERLRNIPLAYPDRKVRVRGLGMAWGLELGVPASASVVSSWALERGLVVEPSRVKDNVLLVMPPLNIEIPVLREGLDRLGEAIAMFFHHQ